MRLGFCKLNDKLREESKKLCTIEDIVDFYVNQYKFDFDLEECEDNEILPMFRVNLLDDGDTVQIIVKATDTQYTESIKDWDNL